jgi:hypothetical protein
VNTLSPEVRKLLEGIQQKVDDIQKGYVVWARVTYGILALVAVIVAFGAVAAVVSIHANHDRIEDIQASRIDVALTTCRDQNERSKNTTKQLDAILTKRIKTATPTEAARLKMSRAFTILLIDALAPRQNCKKVIAQRYGRKNGKGHA